MNLLTFLTWLATISASYVPRREFGLILQTSQICEILSSYTGAENAVYYKVLPFKWWTYVGSPQRFFEVGYVSDVSFENLRSVILDFEVPPLGYPRMTYNNFSLPSQHKYFGTFQILNPPPLKTLNSLSSSSFQSTTAVGSCDAYEPVSDEKENLGEIALQNMDVQKTRALPKEENLEQTRRVHRPILQETKAQVQESQPPKLFQIDDYNENSKSEKTDFLLNLDLTPHHFRSNSDEWDPLPRLLKAPSQDALPIPTEAEPAKPPLFKTRMGRMNKTDLPPTLPNNFTKWILPPTLPSNVQREGVNYLKPSGNCSDWPQVFPVHVEHNDITDAPTVLKYVKCKEACGCSIF